MPTISFFYGIAIRMFVQDHPPPHFHAVYAEWEATFSIESGEFWKLGCRPGRAGWCVNGTNYIETNLQ